MVFVQLNSLDAGVNSSLVIDEISSTIIEQYSKENLEVSKTEENLPNTKGVITTALVIQFGLGVAQSLTASAIGAIAAIAIKKLFTKKEADTVKIIIEDNKVTVQSSKDVNIDVVISLK